MGYIVKLNKSMITCAVLMALGLNQTAFANEDTKQENEAVTIQSDIIANAQGNVIILSQDSRSGVGEGNETSIFQEGDVNGTDFTVIGDGNIVEIEQVGAENVAIGTYTGNNNLLSVLQDGEINETSNNVTGNENIVDVSLIDSTKSTSLKNKISIICFLGDDMAKIKGGIFNLNQKIYRRFHEFNDFQMVMLVSNGQEESVEALKTELGQLSPVDKWNFVFTTPDEIRTIFNGLKTNLTLDNNSGTSHVFIIDKDRNLKITGVDSPSRKKQ